MAAKKRTGTAKKTGADQKKGMGNNQLAALLLFAGALLLVFILFIPGENVWKFLHDCLFGLFGVMAFATPVFVGATAIILALDKNSSSTTATLCEGGGLLWSVCVIIDLFAHSIDGVNFWSYIGTAYTDGAALTGGGFFGAALGYPFSLLFGIVGARIISILLAVVMIMIITGTTLVSLAKKAAKPVQNIKEHYEAKIENNNDATATNDDNGISDVFPEHSKEPEQRKKKPLFARKQKNSKGAKFNIDVPLGPESTGGDNIPDEIIGDEKPVDIDARRNKLMQEYSDNAPDEAAAPSDNDAPPEQTAESAEKPKRKRRSSVNADSVDDLPAAGLTVEVEAEYVYPPTTLLKQTSKDIRRSDEERRTKSELLVNTLKSFGVETRLVGISQGPSVTRYELQPAAGVKISKITNLANDIALNLATAGVRIEAPIPGKAAVGIEVPNKARNSVGIRELLESPVHRNSDSKLCCSLGKDITGDIITMDLAKMPHLLVAGTTGSGKSVCLNSMIISILYNAKPSEVKLIMIDPKSVEFTGYNGIPHLLVPVVTNPQKAAGALGWAVNEMLKRYQIFSNNGVRNISGYNEQCKIDDSLEPMPQIVIFIDELSDLMMAAPNEVEDSICRLAQMARAAGMHMVIATQSPRVDVITGLIKANIPSRIALTVSNTMDSRVIIDMAGAEKLIGYGDMLYFPTGMNKPLRVQGCYVSDEEIEKVVNFLKKQGDAAEYDSEIESEMAKFEVSGKSRSAASDSGDDDGDERDERFDEAVQAVCSEGMASTSFLQRRLKLGYARAARIMDEMYEHGIIGPANGAKPREIKMTYNQWLEIKNGGRAESADEYNNDDYDDAADNDDIPFDEE